MGGVGRRGQATRRLLADRGAAVFQFRKWGSREAVRRRVLEIVNHVDKVGAVSTLGRVPGAPPSRGFQDPQQHGSVLDQVSASMTETLVVRVEGHHLGGRVRGSRAISR